MEEKKKKYQHVRGLPEFSLPSSSGVSRIEEREGQGFSKGEGERMRKKSWGKGKATELLLGSAEGGG